jgi:phosphoribosylcarboxyaminoimidazole (NCAIR) mutase
MVQLAERADGEGVTVVAVAGGATFTCTGMETLTPVPVNVMVPVYAAAAVNEAVLKLTDKLAAFD